MPKSGTCQFWIGADKVSNAASHKNKSPYICNPILSHAIRAALDWCPSMNYFAAQVEDTNDEEYNSRKYRCGAYGKIVTGAFHGCNGKKPTNTTLRHSLGHHYVGLWGNKRGDAPRLNKLADGMRTGVDKLLITYGKKEGEIAHDPNLYSNTAAPPPAAAAPTQLPTPAARPPAQAGTSRAAAAADAAAQRSRCSCRSSCTQTPRPNEEPSRDLQGCGRC